MVDKPGWPLGVAAMGPSDGDCLVDGRDGRREGAGTSTSTSLFVNTPATPPTAPGMDPKGTPPMGPRGTLPIGPKGTPPIGADDTPVVGARGAVVIGPRGTTGADETPVVAACSVPPIGPRGMIGAEDTPVVATCGAPVIGPRGTPPPMGTDGALITGIEASSEFAPLNGCGFMGGSTNGRAEL